MPKSPELLIEELEGRRTKAKQTERRRTWQVVGLGVIAAFSLFFPYVTEKSNVGLISFVLVIYLSAEVQRRWSLEDELEGLKTPRRGNAPPDAPSRVRGP